MRRGEAQHTHTSRKKPILWLTNQVVFSPLKKRTIIYASLEQHSSGYMYSKEKAEYKKRKLSHGGGKCSFCSRK